MEDKCQGTRSTWPWKGYPCGNKAQYDGPGGKRYCYAHIGKVIKDFSKCSEDKKKKDVD